jgi:hypothetical protein
MSRLLFVLLVFAVSGCSQPPEDLRALVAVGGKYSLMAMQAQPEKPAICPNCHGTGVVGDGRTSSPCPICQPKKEAKPCPNGTCPTPR